MDEKAKLNGVGQCAKTHRGTTAGIAVALVIALLIGTYGLVRSRSAQANVDKVRAEVAASASAKSNASASSGPEGVDQVLMRQQDKLREKYGTPKDGFIWDTDGTPLSLGNKDTAPDEVVYTYMRALNTLDFSTAQFYSRRSSVVTTYADYFDSSTASTSDFKDQYKRERYRLGLLSLQVQSVSRSANFTGDKESYTVRAKMIDMSNKSFWLKDKDKLFAQLKDAMKGEADSAKGQQIAYQYVTNAYQQSIDHLQTGTTSDSDVPMREVSFDITVQRYPAQDTGWLVSIDKDLDNLLKDSDGVDPASYIIDQYKDWAR